jgi:hypothetical protein
MIEIKNDWYLVRTIEKVEIREKIFYVCIYSNGLIEKEFLREFGKDIPTILTIERANQSLLETQNESITRAIKTSK